MISWIIILVFVVMIIFSMKLGHFRHKLFLIIILFLALFLYSTLYIVNSKNQLDFSTSEGFFNSMKIYGGWLANGFENLKALSGNAVKMDWTSVNGSILSNKTDSKNIGKIPAVKK